MFGTFFINAKIILEQNIPSIYQCPPLHTPGLGMEAKVLLAMQALNHWTTPPTPIDVLKFGS